ncbi:MAG: hypothetical protein V3574_01990 [Candidatus Moraniibacteriota bacterium]
MLYVPCYMIIVSISGLDGSGKSTQIELLKTSLDSQGKKVFYFHAISFSLANKISEFKNKYCLICKLAGHCKLPSKEEKIAVTQANDFQILLRKIFLKIDLCRFKKLLGKLAGQNFDYLLSDRYFYDSLVNIEYLSKKEISLNYPIIKPDLSIYLQADPALIINRDRAPEQGLQYLVDKKMIYDKLAGVFEMIVVDGNESPDIVQKSILNHTTQII